ncbi:hypothetical protein [Myxacorys almedinensis]|nr:hypothetical protein [Myxacorys almedinensis]
MMSRTYSTQDLLRILAQERQACMNGQRLNLAAIPSGVNPLIDRFVNADGIQRFTAYNDFRQTIHRYQQEHQISGLVWEEIQINGKSLRYPKVDDQLVSLASDLRVLRSHKTTIVKFWRDLTPTMDLYLGLNSGKLHRSISKPDLDRILARAEWASLTQQGKAETLELILQLGWGKPEEALYRRGFPDSGSEYVHAVQPGNLPIG